MDIYIGYDSECVCVCVCVCVHICGWEMRQEQPVKLKPEFGILHLFYILLSKLKCESVWW